MTSTLADVCDAERGRIAVLRDIEHGDTDALNPLGAKGIGESATIGSTPAVQNAVVDALSHLGVRHIDLPLTPENVWRAIRATDGDRRPPDVASEDGCLNFPLAGLVSDILAGLEGRGSRISSRGQARRGHLSKVTYFTTR